MNANVAVSPVIQVTFRSMYNGVVDYTDTPAIMRLVEGEFDPLDPTSWPAPSTHFAAKTSGNPSIDFDAVTGKWYLVWPDPVGGWSFISATITDAVTITGFTLKTAAGDPVGACKLAGVSVTADGQVVVVPYAAVQIPDKPFLVPAFPISL